MDEIDVAILGLAEAVKRGARRKDAERLVSPLALAMRKAFRWQGGLFVRKLRKIAEKFPVAESNPFLALAAKLEKPLTEVMTARDWEVLWYEVVDETEDDFIKPIEKTVTAALEIGAKAMAAELGVNINFRLKNPRAKKYLDNYGAKLVKEINETTREYLHTLLADAIGEGWSYKQVAEAIIERFEEFAVGRPQAHIDSRAHLIAVTEMGNAYAEGNLIMARDLQDAGLLMEKSWSTVGDDKVSEGCLENEAAGWIGLDEEFPSGHQRPLRFPGCRCDLLTRLKEA
jgi:hypothetical protein